MERRSDCEDCESDCDSVVVRSSRERLVRRLMYDEVVGLDADGGESRESKYGRSKSCMESAIFHHGGDGVFWC